MCQLNAGPSNKVLGGGLAHHSFDPLQQRREPLGPHHAQGVAQAEEIEQVPGDGGDFLRGRVGDALGQEGHEPAHGRSLPRDVCMQRDPVGPDLDPEEYRGLTFVHSVGLPVYTLPQVIRNRGQAPGMVQQGVEAGLPVRLSESRDDSVELHEGWSRMMPPR